MGVNPCQAETYHFDNHEITDLKSKNYGSLPKKWRLKFFNTV